MFYQGSRILLGFTWFSVLLQATVGIQCEPGYKATHAGDKCDECPSNQYRPERGSSIECLNCMKCKNSREIGPCTPTSNTKCECFEGFSLLPGSSVACRCPKGSGIENIGNSKKICKKCPQGTFNGHYNSECKPWKKCDLNGVKFPGNTTTDVVCQATPKLDETTLSTLIPPATPRNQTSADTFSMKSTRTAITRKTLVFTSTTPGSAPTGTKQMQVQHWLVPLSCVLALILIQMAIIKLKVKTCFGENKKRLNRQDSTCGKPVEESGEKFIPSAV